MRFLSACVILASLLWAFWKYLPSQELTVVFCDVGQGDGMYMRMPNGTDVVIDGGPTDEILSCVGRYMPFFDRNIEMIILTHPQKDHLQGLVSLVERYKVDYFLTVPVGNTSEGFKDLKNQLEAKNVFIGYPTFGDSIKLGEVELDFMWPEESWLRQNLEFEQNPDSVVSFLPQNRPHPSIISDQNLNLFSIYTLVRFHDFKLLLTGDGDIPTQTILKNFQIDKYIGDITMLKFPHHGSKFGISAEFLDILQPEATVISVGKNSYGHPASNSLEMLEKINSKLWRTDQQGDVIVKVLPSDWSVSSSR
jgi:competence protein ComEC